ncbi:hypothetical protein EIP86_000360 [Pleurotus ostreatoroseus]|nr:hypothetical protein EIP86_000360 [Pleurotus ostreatoroseus]
MTSNAAEKTIPVPPLEEDDVDIQDKGDYEIILPPEDLQADTGPAEKSLYHRFQENQIQKPPYALPGALKKFRETGEFDEGAEGEAMIKLGTMEEYEDNIGRDLVKITEEALESAIAACGPGRPFRDISKAIHNVIQGQNYVVCPSFTGHGIGRGFHQKPWIYHDRKESLAWNGQIAVIEIPRACFLQYMHSKARRSTISYLRKGVYQGNALFEYIRDVLDTSLTVRVGYLK